MATTPAGIDTDFEESAASQAYLRIKEMIVTLALAPGSSIREAELQRQLGVGRTPVREALHRLAHEGVIHIYPRRAMAVAKLGVSEVRQVFEIRLVLESAAVSLAAQRSTAAEIDGLSRLVETLKRSRELATGQEFLRADCEFHRSISRCSQNAYLVACQDHVLTLNEWLWHIHFAARGVRRDELFDHAPIVRAIAARDVAAAETSVRAHIQSAKDVLLSGL